MGEGLRVLSHLKGITDEKIDAIARDVNVQLNQGVNNLDAKADKLVKDVQAETAEVRKIIESAEFGIPAPSLASMTAVSDEAGINVTVTATDATVDYSSDKAVLATTKGVMVRYKDGSYPANKEDGELAFIDDDLFTVDTNGSRVAKAKTHLVVGLTKNHTYCFSAFPYTQQGAHNERLGTGNVAKARWVGNAATLTVNIAKDYDIFDLGEVTVTLHEDSTSETHTQKRTGVGNVVFSGIAAGTYTVSFSGANANCSNPDSQSIVLLAGTPNNIDGVYKAKIGTLEQTSWATISKVSALGIADRFWNVGDVKSVNLSGINTFNFQYSGTLENRLVFVSENCVAENVFSDYSHANSYPFGYIGSDIRNYIEKTLYPALPSDLKSYIIPRNINYTLKNSSSGGFTIQTVNDQKLWLLSTTELFGNISNRYDKPAMDSGSKLEYFTSNSRRIKKAPNTDSAIRYWTRSLNEYYNGRILNTVYETGETGNNNCIDIKGVVVAFLV